MAVQIRSQVSYAKITQKNHGKNTRTKRVVRVLPSLTYTKPKGIEIDVVESKELDSVMSQRYIPRFMYNPLKKRSRLLVSRLEFAKATMFHL